MSINPSLIEAHSKKPGEACEKIVALLGDVPRVELFAWRLGRVGERGGMYPGLWTPRPEVTGYGKE